MLPPSGVIATVCIEPPLIEYNSSPVPGIGSHGIGSPVIGSGGASSDSTPTRKVVSSPGVARSGRPSGKVNFRNSSVGGLMLKCAKAPVISSQFGVPLLMYQSSSSMVSVSTTVRGCAASKPDPPSVIIDQPTNNSRATSSPLVKP